MGVGEISISLTEQESLLVELRKMVEHSVELTKLLQEADSILRTICLEGEFKDRIVGNEQSTLARFTLKAQTFQTLAEVLAIHTETTYKSMVDLDKLLALEIVNQALVDPTTPLELKQTIQENPVESVYALKEGIAAERRAMG